MDGESGGELNSLLREITADLDIVLGDVASALSWCPSEGSLVALQTHVLVLRQTVRGWGHTPPEIHDSTAAREQIRRLREQVRGLRSKRQS